MTRLLQIIIIAVSLTFSVLQAVGQESSWFPEIAIFQHDFKERDKEVRDIIEANPDEIEFKNETTNANKT